LMLIGVVKPLRAALVLCAQLVASIAAAGLVRGLYGGPLRVNTTLSDGTGLAQGVFMEAFVTAQLVFMVFMLAVEKSKTTFLAPVGIGLAVFVAELASVSRTGGSLNPARSFGPSVVSGFKTDHWIYWVGPGLGAMIALAVYKLMKMSVYETANPGQDFDELETKAFNPPVNARAAADVMRPAVPVRLLSADSGYI
jgi:aquaporin related protein